jgi:serine/threonine-protein kinase RsbW
MRRRRDLVIGSELANVPIVGSSVRTLCEELGVGSTEAAEIELAVVEAVNNAIQHAYAMHSGHEVAFSIEFDDGCVVARIRDSGRAMPPGTLEAVPDEPDFDPEVLTSVPTGGMGLVIMKQTMDAVRYESAGGENCLTLLRFLPPEPMRS